MNTDMMVTSARALGWAVQVLGGTLALPVRCVYVYRTICRRCLATGTYVHMGIASGIGRAAEHVAASLSSHC